MRTTCIVYVLIVMAMTISTVPLSATGLPVVAGHPRLLLTSAIKGQLLARKNAADPRWERLRQEANAVTTYTIFPYKYNHRTSEPDNTIYYDYQGEGWYTAAMPLALAFQLTGDTSYSNKLIALVDEMMRAQSDPENLPPNGYPPIEPDDYYATRYVCPVLAIIYDWCYDQLGAQRRASMVTLMNAYFDDIRANAYQLNDHADGNYFSGHLYAAASMGYASFGDNPRAQEMIDYARIRFDNTPSSLLADSVRPDNYFTQLFEGGFLSEYSKDYNGRVISAAPFKGGFDFQGWSYGTGTFTRMIDYMQMVRTATTEDLFAARASWFSQILRATKHSLMPNHFEIDPTGDWGGDYGAVIIRSLPIRLAYLLAGTPDGPGAQHLAYTEIATTSTFPDFPNNIYQQIYQPQTWEDFYYTDTTRPSQELILPPYYSGFAPDYPQAGPTNGARPYFYMRSDWGPSATWSTINMGAAWYDDHQHTNAGHLEITRGDDYLLVEAAGWKGDSGSTGIVGNYLEDHPNSVANTLFFDDFGDYQWTDASQYYGGQGAWGIDEVIAAGQNDAYSYVRSDLSTGYNRTSDSTQQEGRRLDHFYRSFLYLRGANLFLTYDQVKVKTSTNARGQYRKHLRWHFLSRPTIASNTVHVEKGESQLNMTMLLPQLAAITPVDEMNNPDPCDGTVTPCTPYGYNSGTWRIEVRDSLNRLEIPFLTVIEPGAKSSQRSSAVNLSSVGGGMIGARIIAPGGRANIVLFNNSQGQTPTPVTSVTYATLNPLAATHTLCGVAPEGRYAVTISSDSIVTVMQNATGRLLSSASGVLQFDGVSLGVEEDKNDQVAMHAVLDANYPNPFNNKTTIGFTIPAVGQVTLKVFDALGREVVTLADRRFEAGHHTADFHAAGLIAGVYTYMLQWNGQVHGREMVVMR